MKVVIVLEDISDSSQLEALGVEEGWFGRGSRIILTSRDQNVLRFVDEIDIYHVEGLTKEHALELFSMKAFKQKFPPLDYVAFVRRALDYAEGLPLALTVLGSC
ncbi:Disease resistance protein (TIR-NBS-LRR class) family [Euphorbia peplus]|nr:Disease resistance protein (TIR-NBS-LRR class) family [Euphorbia peplus]